MPPDDPNQPTPTPLPPSGPEDRQHPLTVESVLRDRRYSPLTLRALRAFRAEKPWQGTPEERCAKLRSLHGDLCIAYAVNPPVSLHLNSRHGDCFAVNPSTGERQIHVSNRLSVLSYLHEFAHAIGYNERAACDWSINLFRRMFPQSYARLVPVGHLLVRREDVVMAREAMGLGPDGQPRTGTGGGGEHQP